MLVTNSYANSGVNPSSTPQPSSKVSGVDGAYKNYEKDAIKRIEKESEQRNSSQQTAQAQTRFDVDEASLALAASENRNATSHNQKSSSTLGYDQPTNENLTAVSAYKSVDNLAQRESVRDAFGVDLFA